MRLTKYLFLMLAVVQTAVAASPDCSYPNDWAAKDRTDCRITCSCSGGARLIEMAAPLCTGSSMSVCHVDMEGLDEHSFDVYGTDSMQAVNLASNIESVIKKLSAKYDFFWATGEPYFEGDSPN